MKVAVGSPCTATEECTDPVVAQGLCRRHYTTLRRHGDPLHETRPYVRQPLECTEGDCGEPVHARSLCKQHYNQLLYTEKTSRRNKRFWDKVNRSGTSGACWPWTGYLQSNGYGTFGVTGTRLAHRIAYELIVGPVPDGLVLDHLCHTADPSCADTDECLHRRCCNPEHLEPVTRRENIARGRGGDSWGYQPEPVSERPKAEKSVVCTECGNPDKPVYKSGRCRPCYRKWLKDPDVERPSQRTPEQRFWAKVSKTDSCWLWTAGINKHTGYARFGLSHGTMVDGHRYSYELHHGPIPEGYDVHHTCHVRHCVNPAHLQALTRSENLRQRKLRRSA